MTVTTQHIGNARIPLMIFDGLRVTPERALDLAAALAPFPLTNGGYYPGHRRLIGPGDAAGRDYIAPLLREIAPAIGAAFKADSLALVEASFSVVTAPPETLSVPQRGAHFDSVDPGSLAVLHYLGGTGGSGTAFFRQRSTGIELVTAANVERFVAAAECEVPALDGYLQGGNAVFEQIARVDAAPGRLIVYPGSALHSGIIPPSLPLSADPRVGRLTGNIFIRATRNPRPGLR